MALHNLRYRGRHRCCTCPRGGWVRSLIQVAYLVFQLLTLVDGSGPV